jgi:WhiB family redox-sensing transcriptional regulator
MEGRSMSATLMSAAPERGPDWRHRATCRDEDPELFFPVGTTGPALLQTLEAKIVCWRCPVSTQCLSWALESGQAAGVWGGMSEDERRALKRRNVRTAVPGADDGGAGETTPSASSLATSAGSPQATSPADEVVSGGPVTDDSGSGTAQEQAALVLLGAGLAPGEVALRLAVSISVVRRWSAGSRTGEPLVGDHESRGGWSA